MKIQMTAGGAVIATATLENNATAQDFAAMLPLNLHLKDYAATEKIGDLLRNLPFQGVPHTYTPSAGDISYYVAWGNLAVFYKDSDLSSGLVRLGRLDQGWMPYGDSDPHRCGWSGPRRGTVIMEKTRCDPKHSAFLGNCL